MGSRKRNFAILGLVVALLAGSLWVDLTKPTVLGLDLQGGTELVYEARGTPQNPQPTAEDVDRSVEIIRDRIDAFGVSEPEITRIGEDGIAASLPNVQDADRAADQIGTTARLYFYDYEPNIVARPGGDRGDPAASPFNRLYDAVEFASKRGEDCQDCTTSGPTYYLFDSDSLELLGGPSEDRGDLFVNFDGEQPENSEILEVQPGTVVLSTPPPTDDPQTEVDESVAPTQYLVLRDRPALSGDEIENPEQATDQGGAPVVTFDFTDQGQEAFQAVTQQIAQRGADAFLQATGVPGAQATPQEAEQFSESFAIVLDGEIQSAPIINFAENPGGIDGRTGAQISGNFTVQEAQDLAEILKIGALPVNLSLISQSTVSPTLGAQALDQGLLAGLAGLAAVLLFLLVYYRFLGVVAGLGLLVYALFFLALMKLIPVTLTLPGIAGLILTIGVAADSNIVIFERIKEEIRSGKSTLSAISTGYRKGIGTIIDANVITLLTAFILFVLATAGVKGFAFTLGIGTLVSLFTAVLFTQAVLGVLGRSRFLTSPSFLGAREGQGNWKFNFTGLSRYFFTFSGIILLVGGIAFATKQLNLGIDLESGTRFTAALEQPASVEDVRTTLTEAGISGADSAKIQAIDNPDFGDNVVQIQSDAPPSEAADTERALEQDYGVADSDRQTVGPTFGAQVAQSALIAIGFALLVIAAYVAFRFQAKYAVPVLMALVHDILIAAGVYALTGQEVTAGTIAAFLTILGYSMYDSIIVFDRIRENVPRMPRATFSQIVNRSMSEVLTRSLITGLSTVFLVAMLLVFGGETLQTFAFAMIVGVASGTYSSIFIGAPVLTAWKEREPQYRARRQRIMDAMGYVPVFPEDNVVAKMDEVERRPDRAAVAAGGPPARPVEPAVGQADPEPRPEEPVERSSPPVPGTAASAGPARDSEGTAQDARSLAGEIDTPASDRGESAAARARRKRRESRRKHGRPR
ncbi:protein translocase subunit SecD [Thermoleophilia bacterium SCSIO 60948]|nr:protein translocase subunit SecD [Thermoleophilia bacterium SCSIO 60948]